MAQIDVLAGGLLVLLFTILLWLSGRRMRRRKSRRFEGREDLPPVEFWLRFYKDQGVPQEVIEQILPLVARAAEVPVMKLRPSDRFAQELAPAKGWEFDDGLAEIQWFLEAKARKLGKSVDLARILTVDDLIHLAYELS